MYILHIKFLTNDIKIGYFLKERSQNLSPGKGSKGLIMRLYTGCPRRNVPDFGRVFLMLKYTNITQNTYIQSLTVTEIGAREKWGLLAVPNTATCTADTSRDNASVLEIECSVHCACVTLCAVSHVTSPLGLLMYSACNPKDNNDMSASVFVVQFNGFMSLTS